ncbi:hypothetical protein ELI04_02515 [Rhizobium leguminosarum]|nr:hypothetical protein ELI04_02515 [Rhizobium leguminosarum]TAY65331.1 hypothetical protein ELH82_03360 [Rhizobium leguminosarum]
MSGSLLQPLGAELAPGLRCPASFSTDRHARDHCVMARFPGSRGVKTLPKLSRDDLPMLFLTKSHANTDIAGKEATANTP